MTSDLSLIDTALDQARVVDDFVRGVITLGDGRLGGVDERGGTWGERLTKRLPGGRSLARALGASYGPEQLRKAANAADELLDAVAGLTAATGATALAAHIDVIEAGVQDLPVLLRQPDVTATSPGLREAHATLSRTIGILTEAKARVLLADMRAARRDEPGGPVG
jgi:hypothetical protein